MSQSAADSKNSPKASRGTRIHVGGDPKVIGKGMTITRRDAGRISIPFKC